VVDGINVYAVRTLGEAVGLLSGDSQLQPQTVNRDELFKRRNDYLDDFSEVKGQFFAKRALEVAAAGAHNILMVGPPGAGKTMLAKRFPTIMPDMTLDEALEVTAIYSAAGLLREQEALMVRRPFRCVHHTASDIALAGGGTVARPGEISLAHRGVLFLDELPEFHRDALEVLRQPLEDHFIIVSRAARTVRFPSAFILVAAMNPCPCGYRSDPRRACRCSPQKIASYMTKISGPLLDRIDIHIELPAIKYKELSDNREAESSAAIKTRVEQSRERQRGRFRGDRIFSNAQMGTRLIKRHCALDEQAQELLKMAMTELGLSARAYDKILRVSRTIADLAGSENIKPEHLSEAIQYRSLDRELLV
jgi:magnesium chelatase family protein